MNEVESTVRQMTESGRIRCPSCWATRKKKNEKSMSVTVGSESNIYQCFHCGSSGKVTLDRPNHLAVSPVKNSLPATVASNVNADDGFLYEFMDERAISREVTDLYAISGKKYFNGGGKSPAIGFVYGDKESPTAVKWRSATSKAFTQEGAARDFYGLEALPDEIDTLVIVEGELDVLSVRTALSACGTEETESIGVISVPNGAPLKVAQNFRVDSSEDGKFSYVWSSKDLLEETEKIILFCDDDQAGSALFQELSRRIGRAKCWEIENLPEGCKDANDVLMKHGSQVLNDLILNSKPVPLFGVYPASAYKDEVRNLYKKGYGSGVTTGLKALDDLFTVLPGQMTVLTGQPNAGKSSFLDWLTVGLAQRENWRFAVASFENPVALHIAKLSEIICKKPFFVSDQDRITEEELEKAQEFINDHFAFIESKEGLLSYHDVMDRCKQSIMRHGTRGLIIDPYNYLASSSESETHHISSMLADLSAFAKSHSIHCWFVAHPRKMYPNSDGTLPVPKGDSIAGSAAWAARCDLGLSIARNEDDNVEVHCWKSRLKWVGKQGMKTLNYNLSNGIYSDFGDPDMSDLEAEFDNL